MKKLHSPEEIQEFKNKGWGCSHEFIGRDEISHLLSGGSLYSFDGEYGTIITPTLNRTKHITYDRSDLEYTNIEEAEKSLGYTSIEEMEKDFKQTLAVNDQLRKDMQSLQLQNANLELEISRLKEKNNLISFREIESRRDMASLRLLYNIWGEDDFDREMAELLHESIKLLEFYEKENE